MLLELVLSFSGVTFLTVILGAQLFYYTAAVSNPISILFLIIFTAASLALFGMFRLAQKVVFAEDIAIGSITYVFVYIGITIATLTALVGLAIINFLLVAISVFPIVSAIRFVSFSKQTASTLQAKTSAESDLKGKSFSLAVASVFDSLFKGSVFLIISPAVFLCLWLLAKEMVVVWFGFSLAEAAQHQAEKIANGNEYCLVGGSGAKSFEELDERAIILDAFNDKFGFASLPRGNHYRDIHFGILVENTGYHWSFREYRFEKSTRAHSYRSCNKDLRANGSWFSPAQ